MLSWDDFPIKKNCFDLERAATNLLHVSPFASWEYDNETGYFREYSITYIILKEQKAS